MQAGLWDYIFSNQVINYWAAVIIEIRWRIDFNYNSHISKHSIVMHEIYIKIYSSCSKQIPWTLLISFDDNVENSTLGPALVWLLVMLLNQRTGSCSQNQKMIVCLYYLAQANLSRLVLILEEKWLSALHDWSGGNANWGKLIE